MSTTDLISGRYGVAPAHGIEGEPPETVAGLLARRSIRRYADAPIDDALLEMLLACAQSAPTKSNLQQYSIVVTRDQARRMKLAEICPKTGHMKYCPVFLTFCGDMRRGQWLTALHGLEHRNNSLDTFFNATVDAAMAMQCFITAAEAFGLGCAPISDVRNNIRAFSDALELPPGVFPVAGLTLGWPAWEGRMNTRLPPDVVVHRETYDDSGLADAIAPYDDRRRESHPIPPDSQRQTEIYGVVENMGWSENAARQLSVPERADFRAYLLEQGFDLA